MATTEFGHASNRVYIDQDGQFHLNGASIYTDEVGTALATGDLGNIDGLSATAAEINAVADLTGRIINIAATETAVALTATTHGERIVVLPVITSAGLTITLPAATGTGNKYTILNNGVQTVSTTVTALAGDIFHGLARGWHLTAGANDAFAPTAADIKYTMDCTTTGGDKGDILEFWDIATDKWFVKIDFFGSGTLATGFA